MIVIPELNRYTIEFPPPTSASQEGIVAWGGDLTPSRIIRAYQEGIFPWYAKDDPILWWSPDPRFIMELDEFRLTRSLKKSLKKFEYKIDADFSGVIRSCATVPREGQNGTWILPEVIEAYETLHALGVAHSIESYHEGELVGGLYGLAIGGVFCGESMFSKKSDASKAAYYILIQHLKKWRYSFVDCQVPTPHLASLGAKEISREEFLKRLYKVRFEKPSHHWSIDKSITDKYTLKKK
ncbi:Leucyl/phenylalanyl-tRNA--protein transferase [hydrothermal vent metagenome]|uniref:Leucyl/phenylalanyl-tRNA--protein transferase n=1 Tax=hydrothermal vent metagenome TaxID=652676 RepID=A0A1W1C115_9ZZZZ